MNPLVLTTYRKLLRGAIAVDKDAARRAILAAVPDKSYDHQSNVWQQLNLTADMQAANQAVNEAIRLLNGGKEWYWPQDEETSVKRYLKQQFQGNEFSMPRLNAAFAGMKVISHIESEVPKLRSAPDHPPGPWEFESKNTIDGHKDDEMCLLVAHPLLPDFFRHTVILMTKVEEDGAVGLIVNKPLVNADGVVVPVWSVVPDSFHDVFTKHLANNPVMLGGPVASPTSRQQALFFLHRIEGIDKAMKVGPGLFMSGELDQIRDKLDKGDASPTDIMVMMGYSGWGTAQLQGEIDSGSWAPLTQKPGTSCSSDLVFTPSRDCRPSEGSKDDLTTEHPSKLWTSLLGSLGPKHQRLSCMKEVCIDPQRMGWMA